ncbi:tRNA modification GTPase MnmE [Roseovarius sp. A-2]|uniref:tRNA uridine-5-carboxymethylaminomethyl(34) synthesis GTPase MnmE n=1 Tax=Roseovarius sp. A-2 TaxID=1570360 RepID=UPI0009B5506F|nr:tRNA uridine-5-carboxymethylaminomethyl(34) synthesis GTPase MnmE [Roseovarius sp. A-2]GAW36340.1 tRNA modification GTPase MnmE [Roseovarius sp. A-2]
MDTIFALSTARGKAGVAIIRISGPAVPEVAQQFFGGPLTPRKATLRVLYDDEGERLDEALVLYFEDGASFTGEPVLELQTHGSQAVVSAVLRRLGRIAGLRAADAGEFTRRALANERLDLTQVEALADLIDAETEAQRRQAMRLLSGELGLKAAEWRRMLIRAVALVEATIDFADEDVPVDVSPEVVSILSQVIADLTVQIEGRTVAERIREGFEVAILGPPNIGKSTLLNALAGREAAITSEYAGTTRDVIEVRMDLRGLPVTLLDTAGLRETKDAVETIGVERAKERARTADLRVFLSDGEAPPPDLFLEGDLCLFGKGDLRNDNDGSVSGLTGKGVDGLVKRVGDVLEERSASVGVAVRIRHEEAMRLGMRALESALSMVEGGESCADIAAEELHSAIRALDSLVGRIDVEAVLDEIFSSFCLGK